MSRGFARAGTAASTRPARPLEAQVLQRMHREVHAAFQQRCIDLGGEEFLALHARQRHVEHLVAARVDAHQFDFESGMRRAQRGRNLAALHPGQCRATRTQAQVVCRIIRSISN